MLQRGNGWWGPSQLENETDTVLDVGEEVVDQGLHEVIAVGRRQRAKADGEEPDMKVRDGEPRLKSCGEMTGWERVYDGLQVLM
jgi:hypothetical protein